MYIIEVCLGDKKYPLRLEKYFDIFSWSVNEHFPKAVVSYDTCKCIIVDKKHETYSQINSTSTVTPYPYNKRSYTVCGGYSQQLLYKIKTLVYYSAECVSVLSYWQCSWALGIVEKWHRAVFACIYIGGIFLTPLSVCIYESYFYFNRPVLMY